MAWKQKLSKESMPTISPPPLDADSALRTLMRNFDYFRGLHGPPSDWTLIF